MRNVTQHADGRSKTYVIKLTDADMFYTGSAWITDVFGAKTYQCFKDAKDTAKMLAEAVTVQKIVVSTEVEKEFSFVGGQQCF